MKIAMFSDAYWPRVNGVSVSVEAFSTELMRLGHEVVIVCAEYPDSQQLERRFTYFKDSYSVEKQPALIRIPSHRVLISKEDRVAKFEKWFWVKNKLDEFAPDIIHVNSEFVIGNFGIFYSKYRKLPLVFTFHTMWEDYAANYISFVPQRPLRKMAASLCKIPCKSADSIIAPTKKILEVIRRYGIKKHVYLLPTGIDSNLFKVNENEKIQFENNFFERFPLLKNKKILLYLGRVGQEKNIHFLFDVLQQVQKSLDTVMLCIVGDGPDLESLKEDASSRNIASSVVFTGYINRKDVPYMYALSTVFVFASKTETQGLVTIEAMLSGLPVVAIGEMGTVDVMQGDNGGFMVHDSIEEFSSRVLQLLGDDKLHAVKKAEGREFAKRWTIGEMGKKLVSVYEETQSVYAKAHEKKWYQFWRKDTAPL